MITNEIQRIRRKLELLEQEGAKQLLSDFHKKFFPYTQDIKAVDKIAEQLKRDYKSQLKALLPETTQLRLKLK